MSCKAENIDDKFFLCVLLVVKIVLHDVKSYFVVIFFVTRTSTCDCNNY